MNIQQARALADAPDSGMWELRSCIRSLVDDLQALTASRNDAEMALGLAKKDIDERDRRIRTLEIYARHARERCEGLSIRAAQYYSLLCEFELQYPDIRQLQDGFKVGDPSWSEWDQSVVVNLIQLGAKVRGALSQGEIEG